MDRLMKTSRTKNAPDEILVVGLARNISRRMERTIDVLRQATSTCSKVHFLVIESDSDDDTPKRLKQLSNEVRNFRFRSLGQLRHNTEMRTERIAICRNTYLDELRDHPAYRNVSHLVAADLDGVCKDLTRQAFLSCWDQPEPWDVCAANQGDFYYDIWALRHPSWCPTDCWHDFEKWVPIVGRHRAREMFIFSRMIHIPTSRPMVEVDSAFGGLAVYQRDAILSARYSGVAADGSGMPVCEHVSLCQQMRAAGHRIFINPALINARQTRHASSKKFFRRFRRNVWSAIAGRDYSTEKGSPASFQPTKPNPCPPKSAQSGRADRSDRSAA
jgi:hypothetical protein